MSAHTSTGPPSAALSTARRRSAFSCAGSRLERSEAAQGSGCGYLRHGAFHHTHHPHAAMQAHTTRLSQPCRLDTALLTNNTVPVIAGIHAA